MIRSELTWRTSETPRNTHTCNREVLVVRTGGRASPKVVRVVMVGPVPVDIDEIRGERMECAVVLFVWVRRSRTLRARVV